MFNNDFEGFKQTESSSNLLPTSSNQSEPLNQENKPSSTQLTQKSKLINFDFGRCRVCKDKATGIHYGVPTCEACKGFFKRSIENHPKYACFYGYKCPITPQQRIRCKYCRWKACLDAGMSYDGIKMGRIPKSIRSQQTNTSSSSSTTKLNTDINLNIKISNLKFDFSLSDRLDFNMFQQNTNLVQSSFYSEYAMNKSNENFYIIMSLLKDKCYQIFIKYNQEFDLFYNRYKLNNGNVQNLFDENLPPQLLWDIFLKRFEKDIKVSLAYAKELPGFENLSKTVFKRAVADRVFFLTGLRTTKLFNENEFYMFISENTIFSRQLFSKIFGDKLTDYIFSFHNQFNMLNLSDQEISVLIPYLLTCTDKYTDLTNELKEINAYYSRLLLYVLSLNGRDKDFFINLKETCSVLPYLNKKTSEINLQSMLC